MKSIFIVFAITVLFLVGMTKFTNDTNYNEALRYVELSQYMSNMGGSNNLGGNIFLETVDLEVSFEGEVKSNKTVEVKYGTYISQGIEMIGGLTEDADLRCINLDLVILESTTYYVPGGKDLEKVSINTATKDELMSLSQIGGVIATRIVEYREMYGGFSSLESLLNVNGIGAYTFNKIKDSVML